MWVIQALDSSFSSNYFTAHFYLLREKDEKINEDKTQKLICCLVANLDNWIVWSEKMCNLGTGIID